MRPERLERSMCRYLNPNLNVVILPVIDQRDHRL